MPLFHRIKDPDGTFRMVQQNVLEVQPIDLTQPLSPALEGGAKKRHKCKVCNKEFAGTGIMAMHFARQHKELATDKDTWREHVEKI